MKKVLAVILAVLVLPFAALAQGPAANHSVALVWVPPTGVTLLGSNVYRIVGSCPANPSLTAFTKLNTSPIQGTTFTDTAVTAGSTYCYTQTNVASGGESGTSNLVQVVIPISIASNTPPPSTGLAPTAVQ